MTILKNKIYLLFLSSVLILGLTTACDSNKSEPEEPSAPREALLDLVFPTRSVGIDMTEKELDPLENYFTPEESYLIIEQRTQNHSLSFEENISDTNPNGFLYKYVWKKGENDKGTEANTVISGDTPNWNDGYNFTALPAWNNPMKWETILSNGAIGTDYAFGALYYPVDNGGRRDIETDQSTLEGLKKSNILGTYHSTSTPYERLRFRLYHLMACMRVTIWVPVEKTDETGQTGYKGVRKINATMLNLIKDFNIEWGSLPSDYPPSLMADTETGVAGKISMYPHTAPTESKNVDITVFGLEGTDDVYEYTFTGLFPPQTISNTADVLQFDIMNENGRQIVASYTWSTAQLMSNLEVNSGTITNLILYFPRGENTALLVKSEILDWEQADTVVTVTPDNDSSSKHD